jgi:hypothetical protein
MLTKRRADGGVTVELYDRRSRRLVGAAQLSAEQRRRCGAHLSDDGQFPVDDEAS